MSIPVSSRNADNSFINLTDAPDHDPALLPTTNIITAPLLFNDHVVTVPPAGRGPASHAAYLQQRLRAVNPAHQEITRWNATPRILAQPLRSTTVQGI